jgi:flavin reductase (DIM6/NTAB) family NADH-FMN oxidoreductase RutF
VDSVERTFIEITTGLDYVMVIVTACSAAGPAGCLVGFSTQCSVHPSRYLVCLSDKNRTQRIASEAAVLGVHFLAADAIGLARLFGEETTDESDTFSRCRWHPGPSGVPILDDCGRWFAGRIIERSPFGDHVGYLLEPVAAHSDGPERGLYFDEVKDLDPGHEP